MAFTFYCAQLEGEQSKNALVEDKKKRRARMTMERYDCNGWLHVTVDEDNLSIIGLRITHHQPHHPYTDISIPEDIVHLVEKMKNSPAAKVGHQILYLPIKFMKLRPISDLGNSTSGKPRDRINREANLSALGPCQPGDMAIL